MNSDSYYELQTNILFQADDFAEAYRRCIEGKNPKTDENGGKSLEVVNIPAIVNAAFSCELYLKYLTVIKREHKLKPLFDSLNNATKNRIKNNVSKSLDQKIFNFDMLLERASNVFVSWRYIFEEPHTDGFMGTFINEHLMFFGLFLPELKKIAHEKYDLENNCKN